jgi:hypothetical protein
MIAPPASLQIAQVYLRMILLVTAALIINPMG